MTKVIAFQGAHGANSEIACSYFCSESETVPCETFEDTFDTLLEGRANLAMIPIENSQAGRVADVHNLLPESRLSIVAEHYQPIYHHLLALPNVPFSNIKQIRSHTMALAQCREKLRKWGVSCHVSADTAGAARDLVLSQDPTVAVVATRLAAEIYKLNILEENIEDSSDNMTRFVVLSRQEDWPSINVKSMTTIIFCLKSLPSALYKCLGGFATNKINVTKIESYVSWGNFNAAQFYMDFEGHPHSEDVALALDELRYFSTDMRIIGVYPQSPYRQSMREVKA